MTFRRTTSGLSNLHIFYDVDTIVFIEGGKGFSKEDIYEGNFSSYSIDIKFWAQMFAMYYPNTKFQFRAVGSKSVLSSIADDIELGIINNVYVAMDRDHDNKFGRLKKTKGVVYTYGYSWENDVWSPMIIQEIFSSICIVHVNKEDVRDLVDDLFERFSNDIHCAVCADVYLNATGNSFIPRSNPDSLIIIHKSKEPLINKQRLSDMFCECSLDRKKIVSYGNKLNIQVTSDCYGHLLAIFCYRIIMYLIRKFTKSPNIPKDYVYSLSIDKFIEEYRKGKFQWLSEHYSSYFSSLAA